MPDIIAADTAGGDDPEIPRIAGADLPDGGHGRGGNTDDGLGFQLCSGSRVAAVVQLKAITIAKLFALIRL